MLNTANTHRHGRKLRTGLHVIGTLVALLVPLQKLSGYEKAERQVTADTLEKLERHITRNMDRKKIPGLAVALVDQGQAVLLKGYGVRSVRTNEPVNERTLFHIGSVHKSFTSMLAARLVDLSVVTWASTPTTMRPDWQVSDTELRGATLYQMLSMTSGIVGADEDDFWDRFGNNATPADVFTFLGGLELFRSPGERFSYSNLSASLAGYLLTYAANAPTVPAEANLNQDYSNVLKQHILTPMGMTTSTIFVSEARATGNFAVPHVRERREIREANSEDRDEDPLAPSGSLKSNALEMSYFLITQLNEGVSPTGTRVVGAANLTHTWEPNPISRRARYALGWETKQKRGLRTVMHEGAYDNFTSIVVLFPERRVGLAILCNTEYIGKLMKGAVRVLQKALR